MASDSIQSLDRFVNVQIAPQAFGADTPNDARHSVHVVVEKPKAANPMPKMQSFAFSRPFFLRGMTVPMSDIMQILWDHGLSETVPLLVTSVKVVEHEGATPSEPRTFTVPSFDDEGTHEFAVDHTHSELKGVPQIWPFNWGGIPCNVQFAPALFYIRVLNLNAIDAERVIRELLMALLKRQSARLADRGTVMVYTCRDLDQRVSWVKVNERPSRSLDTIYLDLNVKQRVVSQLRQFIASQTLYAQYGVPWKRVHLFSGPPGTGKTSFAFALASLFKRHLAKLTVNPNLTASQVEVLFATVPDNCFVLLEDVDALFVGRQATVKQNLDFSTLINALDGVGTKQGLVVFLTTNHLEQLDPALLRPGRVDSRVEFSHAHRTELAAALGKLGARWTPEHEKLLDLVADKGVTIAALQQFLFDGMMLDRAALVPHVDELLAFSASVQKKV